MRPLPRRAPLENCAIAPDRMQNDRQLARDGNGGALPADTFWLGAAPTPPTPMAAVRAHEHRGGLVERAGQQRIVGLTDAANPLVSPD
jgi:hypothetical protein